MRILTAFCLLAVFWAGSLRAAEKSAPPESKPLFNGKDLTGWTVVNDAKFAVTNGNLLLVTGMGWLRTDKEFGDFVLELEYRPLVPEYDSGIFVRCVAEGQPWPKDGWQVNLRHNAIGGLVRGYKSVLPAEVARLPVGQWVKIRIECRGKRITLDVDDERSWEYAELDRERGYIGLQAEDRSFEFRNLRITELPTPATETKQ